eukprot:Gb_14098 [translate_table: standard]
MTVAKATRSRYELNGKLREIFHFVSLVCRRVARYRSKLEQAKGACKELTTIGNGHYNEGRAAAQPVGRQRKQEGRGRCKWEGWEMRHNRAPTVTPLWAESGTAGWRTQLDNMYEQGDLGRKTIGPYELKTLLGQLDDTLQRNPLNTLRQRPGLSMVK